MATPDLPRAGAESAADDADLPNAPAGTSIDLVDVPAGDDLGDGDAATVAEAPRSRLRRVLRHGRRWLLRLAALLCITAFVALAVGPHLFGYRTVTMRTGSMRPFAQPGDMLVVRPEPLRSVRVGQVLTIEAPIPGHPVVSHRVVAVENRTGTVVVRTKGDANPEPDHWVAQLGGTRAWRTVVVVPHVGRLMAALHRPAIHLVSSWLLPVWLLAEVLRFVWRRPRPARPEDVEDELDVGQNEPEPA